MAKKYTLDELKQLAAIKSDTLNPHADGDYEPSQQEKFDYGTDLFFEHLDKLEKAETSQDETTIRIVGVINPAAAKYLPSDAGFKPAKLKGVVFYSGDKSLTEKELEQAKEFISGNPDQGEYRNGRISIIITPNSTNS